MKETRSANVLGEKQWQERSMFFFFLAASMKKVRQQRNSQSIYFVTGGVFERDEEEDAEEAKINKKLCCQSCSFSFYSAFSSLVKCACSVFHGDVAANICQDIAC